MEKIKRNKGITLLALIITIIVLLILAGVTIAALNGKNGILSKANNAKTQSNHSKVYEALKLEEQSYIIEQNTGRIENDLIGYFKEKQIIDDNNIVDVQKLLGAKLSTGNGIGTTDLYKLEKVPGEGTTESYALIYYGFNADEITELGKFKENKNVSSKDDMILVVNPSYTDGLISFSMNTDTDVTIDFGDGTVEKYSGDMAEKIEDVEIESVDSVKVASLQGFKVAARPAIPPEGNIVINHEYQDYSPSFEIKISGDLDDIYCFSSSLISIKQWGNMNIEKMCFDRADYLETIAEPTEHSFNLLQVCFGDFEDFVDFGAFSRCVNLKTVPQNLFKKCTNLTNMSRVFENCTNLERAPEIPSSVTSMDSTFEGCTGLTTAPEIPSSVTSMYCTFKGCTSLTTAPEIPSSVTSMSSTFYGCTSLTTVPEIPSSVTSMDGTFFGCTSLTTAPEIPSSVTSMDDTFSRCTSLTTAPEIPSSVTSMDGTFSGCTSLTTAPEIPSSVTNMNYTFSYCEHLTGDLVINAANISKYKSCLNGTSTVTGTDLKLSGSCSKLGEILQTKSSNSNISLK